jgi:hypothetical protein
MAIKVNVNGQVFNVNTGTCSNFTGNSANSKFVTVTVKGEGDDKGKIYKVNSGNCTFTANAQAKKGQTALQTAKKVQQVKQTNTRAIQPTLESIDAINKKIAAVDTAIEQNLNAYCDFKNIQGDQNAEEKAKLKEYLGYAAYSMCAVLGVNQINQQVPEIKNRYTAILDKYTNNANSEYNNKDGPMFIDFVYGYTNQGSQDYSSQPIELDKENKKMYELSGNHVNFYNKNKAGLIACCAYLEYKYGVAGNVENFKEKASKLLINIVNIEESKLMCVFANLTWRVFEIAKNETETCDFKIPIIDLLNHNKDITVENCGKKDKSKQNENYTVNDLILTLKKDVVQIYAAAIVLSGMEIPTYNKFIKLESDNKQIFKTKEYYEQIIKIMALKIGSDELLNKLYTYYKPGDYSDRRGGKFKSSPKASAKRIMINGKSRVVYVGTRGGEYVKMSGEFVTVKSAIKSAKKQSSKVMKNQGGGLVEFK